jgi:hypothetical protein
MKFDYDKGSYAAKRRIATEIVSAVKQQNGRFLCQAANMEAWVMMTDEQAVSKACQVMRDFKRPGRTALREARGQKRQRSEESTPMGITIPKQLLDSAYDNPSGVHDHDVLCGRGQVSKTPLERSSL